MHSYLVSESEEERETERDRETERQREKSEMSKEYLLISVSSHLRSSLRHQKGTKIMRTRDATVKTMAVTKQPSSDELYFIKLAYRFVSTSPPERIDVCLYPQAHKVIIQTQSSLFIALIRRIATVKTVEHKSISIEWTNGEHHLHHPLTFPKTNTTQRLVTANVSDLIQVWLHLNVQHIRQRIRRDKSRHRKQ